MREADGGGAARAALPAVLVGVHAAVGGLQQRLECLPVLAAHRHAHADAQGEGRAVRRRDALPCDRTLQVLGAAFGLGTVLARQRHDELVAAVAGAEIGDANLSAERAGHGLQRQVAGLVPVDVVDRLEIVEVDHDERVGHRLVLRRAQALIQVAHERAGVRQVGQRIGQRRRPHALELNRVRQHRRGLPTQAFEETQVGLGVRLRIDVIGGEDADERLVVDERERQGRLEQRADLRGRRPRRNPTARGR